MDLITKTVRKISQTMMDEKESYLESMHIGGDYFRCHFCEKVFEFDQTTFVEMPTDFNFETNTVSQQYALSCLSCVDILFGPHEFKDIKEVYDEGKQENCSG